MIGDPAAVRPVSFAYEDNGAGCQFQERYEVALQALETVPDFVSVDSGAAQVSFVTSDTSLDGTINVVEITGYLKTVPETPSGANWHFSLVVNSVSDPCLEGGTFVRSPEADLPAITYKFWDAGAP